MTKKFKAWFVSLSFGWLLLLAGCQHDMIVNYDRLARVVAGLEYAIADL